VEIRGIRPELANSFLVRIANRFKSRFESQFTMIISRTFLRHAFALIAVTTAASLLPVAHADGLQDASKLLKQGQPKPALEQVDSYLSVHPRDASGRFLRGVILTEMNRNAEAIAVFSKLTEDYPALPEPYNNLAVIYAQQKQYDKAKSALEAAIRTHPSYATAHENLGDIYARMASQAYDKALQLDSSNKAAQTKLSMIRDLITASARTSSPATATPPVVVAVAKPAEVSKPSPPAAAPPPATQPSAPSAPKPAEPVKPAVKPAAVPTLAPTLAPAPEPAPNGVHDDVAKALVAWADAWSRKEAKDYLAFYASDFKTPGGESRAAWAAERTRRVTKPGKISVTIEDARVTPAGTDQVVVKFRQHYKSASLSSSSNKTLLMAKQNGQWKILQERIGG
jgi:tetratricopeptide (TPR) repeat protein